MSAVRDLENRYGIDPTKVPFPDMIELMRDERENQDTRNHELDSRLADEHAFTYSDGGSIGLGDISGHRQGTPKELQRALGHWADQAPRPSEEDFQGDSIWMQQFSGASTDEKSEHLSSHHIGDHYLEGAGLDKLEKAETGRNFDLSTVEGRLQAANNLTQNDPNNPNLGDVTCGASSMVTAAMLNGGANGSAGLETLMKAMDHERRENYKASHPGVTDEDIEKDEKLKASLASSTSEDSIRKTITDAQDNGDGLKLSTEQLHRLQQDLYTEMRTREKAGHATSTSGLHDDTMQGFINDNKDFHDMMVASHMSVLSIDCSGEKDRPAKHAVLQIGDNAVYDPEARDAGQLVTDPHELYNYQNARLHEDDDRSKLVPAVQ